MIGTQPSGHVDQTKISYNGVTILQKDVLGLEIFMYYATVMKVAHALGYLLSNDDQLVEEKLVLPQMQQGVQSVALAQTGHDGQLGRVHTCPHEED